VRVFITGASSGIGAALARHYAVPGATLGLAARRRDALEALSASLPVPSRPYPLDVRDDVALREAASDFIARFGCPDLVIANAGVSVGTDPARADDLAVLREVMEINVYGVANTLQPFIGPMRAAGRGVLVGIASVAGYRGMPGAGAYSASKAAAISYLESVRAELRGSGVSVVTVSPGYIATPMTADNPYAMPFILSAEAAAGKIARLIARERSYAVIPWQMAIVARLLRVVPNSVFDRIFSRTPRKARRRSS
jgi:short-subunit dehydrogenase